ncbi:MAG: hypothetical protein RBS80_17190 [Thermoguttaceae bacterium]|jgi:hypothetical protein|nr:hypothetical protein [Thermoguttaceae bacterium]
MRFRTETENSRHVGHRRWWPAMAIAGAGAAGFVAVQGGFVQVSGRPAVDALLIAAAAGLLLAAWIAAFAPVRLILRAQLLVALGALQAVALLSVRLDGFAGDGRMILAWRWTPRPEVVWENLDSQVSRDGPVHSAPVDLSTAGPHDWPAFRGADRSGTAAGVRLAPDWRRHPPRLLWRRKVGAGWSSFAVAGRYCVTQEQRGEWETVVCYGFGQVILAGDLLLVQTEPGDVALVEATPAEHRELARFPALQQRTWNHPALAGDILLVRNDREAACYQLDTR